MKKIIMMLGAFLMTITASAEGYQVNTLSTRQLGMGHVGTGMKLGAESQLFNPAGMAYMEKTLDISGGVTGISPTGTATVEGGKEWITDNKVSTPLYLYAAFSIYDNLKAGVSLTTPYGSNINWTNNWPGAVLSQKAALTSYTIQPTLSWRITKKLAVGAGLMISWGNVDLSKGLVNASSLDLLLRAQGQTYQFGTITPASVNLKGTAKLAVGVNVGAMYDITDKLTVGVSYRSKMMMKVQAGEAQVTYANELAETLLQSSVGLINSANFKSEMPMPWVLSLGASYKVSPKLILAADAQLTGWNAYKNLDINFIDEQLSVFNQHLEKNYHNSWAFRVGAQYAVTHRFDVRVGLSYDRTPVDNNYYNPETPGMQKFGPSVGLSFRPIKNLSVDLACSYIAGLCKGDKSYTYEDLIYKSYPMLGQSSQQTLTAKYTTKAWCPAIGLGYSF